MSIAIKEVLTKKDLIRWVEFPNELYKDNEYFVPFLRMDEIDTFTKEKNPSYAFCETKLFLAYRDGKIVGRIAGLINPQLKSVSLFFRYGLLFAAAAGGIYAVIFGICGITLWLCTTDSFGLPFSDYLFPDKKGAARDTLVRVPWPKLRQHSLTGGRDYDED